ncbi:J domain-containing protein [Halotydeus destructor]|nr:J domain-containing protein [Halotydeus destructor]
MDAILNFSKPDHNYYQILGCTPSSTVEQLQTEYKIKARQCHPDKSGDDSNSSEFKLVQEAKGVLFDPEKRAAYDKWLTAGIALPFQQWMNLSKSGHAFHWASQSEKKNMIEMEHETELPLDQDKSECNAFANQDSSSETLRKFRNYEI